MGENNTLPPKSSAKADMETLENGKPIFSRALLEYVDRVWSSGEGKLIINDVYGKPHEYEVNPKWKWNTETAEGYTPYAPNLEYKSYQHLADTSRLFDDDNVDMEDQIEATKVPIRVTFCSFFHGTRAYEDVLAEYQTTTAKWLSSDACKALKRDFTIALVGAVSIDRIVCFALGGLQRGNISVGQHACIQTIREVLPNDATGNSLPVFVQDPGYTAIDKRILASEHITVVEDPKGFLEITPNTLVMSLSPDIPVRQIIADVQWPAALICDTIHADETDFQKREFVEFEGAQVRVSPYTTDPCSKRVQAMVAGCSSFKFPDIEFFGNVTAYLRRLEPGME